MDVFKHQPNGRFQAIIFTSNILSLGPVMSLYCQDMSSGVCRVYGSLVNPGSCWRRTQHSSDILSGFKKGVKEHIVLREIHLRTMGRHLSMGSHSVICYPTEVTTPPSPQPGRLVLDLSTP